MLKIIVFDSGWGGELVADFLMDELRTVEVVRVIDWAHASYCGKSEEDVCKLVDLALRCHIGRADLIVLGGYAVSLSLNFLREKYPEQKFVGMSVNYDMILRSRNFPSQVVVLADRLTSESPLRRELRSALPYSTLIIPDCAGWEDLINENSMTVEILRQDLGRDFVLTPVRKRFTQGIDADGAFDQVVSQITAQKPELLDEKQKALRGAIAKFALAAEAVANDERDNAQKMAAQNAKIEPRNALQPDVILLLNTHFWDIKLELEELFGYKVRVLDFREKLLHDVCAALKLRGVHGRRAK